MKLCSLSLVEYQFIIVCSFVFKLYSEMDNPWSWEVDAALSDTEGNSGVSITPGRHLNCADSDDEDVLMLQVGKEEVQEVIGTEEERAKMHKREKNWKRKEKQRKREKEDKRRLKDGES